MSHSGNDGRESLVTRNSIALAHAPPRAPPHDSAHRKLLLAQDPSEAALVHHRNHDESDDRHHHSIQRHSMMLLRRYHTRESRMPHPHLPAGPELGDQITRALGVMLPLTWQNRCRDSGGFRFICDWLVTCSAPTLALVNPSATLHFLKLTRARTRIRYGEHRMQFVDLFFPPSDSGGRAETQGLLFFVHGGAWGAGVPWFYRLTVVPFLEMNMAVAVVGYRTYPDADVTGQVEDLERARSELKSRYPGLWKRRSEKHGRYGCIGTCLMGHSSGAHIALLMLANLLNDRIDQALVEKGKQSHDVTRSVHDSTSLPVEFDSFIGLSGPYDISHHFDYEAGRGVEELSPMKPVCGYSREEFRRNSPVFRLRSILSTLLECDSLCLDRFLPPVLLLHGVEDNVVPFTATADAARMLRSCGISKCDEVYLAQTGHQDVIMHIMLGGKARDAVVGWLTSLLENGSGSGAASPRTDLTVSSKL